MPSRLHIVSVAVIVVLVGVVVFRNNEMEKPNLSEAVPQKESVPYQRGSAFIPKPFEAHEPEISLGTVSEEKVEPLFPDVPEGKDISGLRVESYVPADTKKEISKYSNPNFENLDIFLDLIAKEEKAKGLDDATIKEHASVITEYARTGPDFRKMFEEEVSGKKAAEETSNPFFAHLEKIVKPITQVLFPTASALTGVPFGGPILFVYPCTCPPGIFALTIGPPTPMVLEYTALSQGFASFNLPASRFVLGLFIPKPVPACFQFALVGCFPIFNAGMIQPIVGSSPI